jgi:hypothetical protein
VGRRAAAPEYLKVFLGLFPIRLIFYVILIYEGTFQLSTGGYSVEE